jgi:hypothetical protein
MTRGIVLPVRGDFVKFLAVLALLAGPLLEAAADRALAAQTTLVGLSTTAYTDLGAAPVMVGVNTGRVSVIVQDSPGPSLVVAGNVLLPGQNLTFNPADNNSHVWALALDSGATIAYAPVYSSGVSGLVTQGTSPWVISGAVTGTFWPYTLNSDGGVPNHVVNWPTTQPVSVASAQAVDCSIVTIGCKADVASTATDTTPVTQMSVEKQISKSVQAAVTALGSPFQAGGSIGNSTFGATEFGTWAVTPTVPAASTMTLTSTTTAYTAGQLVANNGTAGSITNPSFSMPSAGGAIPRLRLYSDDTGTGWQGATVQVDLWSSSPTWANGDHGTWKPATGTAAHLASYSCTFPSAVWGDGLATECSINQGNYASVIATTIYWSVEVTTASGNAVTASQHLNLRPELN